jgi:hypothetical protein
MRQNLSHCAVLTQKILSTKSNFYKFLLEIDWHKIGWLNESGEMLSIDLNYVLF